MTFRGFLIAAGVVNVCAAVALHPVSIPVGVLAFAGLCVFEAFIAALAMIGIGAGM